MIDVSTPEISKGIPRIASLKDSRAVVEDGGCTTRDNFLISPSNMTNLGWVLLQRLRKRFDMLVLGDHLSVLATMKSILWKTLIVMVTWTIGYSQLLTVDSTTGWLKTSSQSPSARSNCYFLFYCFKFFL